MQGAGVAVRLEYRHDPAVEPGLGGGQSRPDLGGVVAVVVDHRDAAGTTKDLESALDAREPGQRFLDGGERDLEVQADADRREGVEHVVAAGDLERELAESAPALEDLEAARHAGQAQAPPHEVGARLHAVRDDPLLDPWDQQLDVRLIEAEDGRTVERHPVHERDERVADGVEAPVVIEMLGVDGRDDRDRRRELQERAIGFVGLGDQVLALAEPGVRAEARHPPAHDDRRIVAALGEHGSDHRGGRRLAVGARDRDAVLETHQLGQHLGAGNRRDLSLARDLDLDVVPRDRRRIDDDVGALDVRRLMADEDLRAQLGQSLDRVVALLVGAGHPVAEVQ